MTILTDAPPDLRVACSTSSALASPLVMIKPDRRGPDLVGTPQQPKNRLLAALPAADHERLAGVLRFTNLRSQQILQKQGEPITTIYFPANGVCSLSRTVNDGGLVELAAVGSEGFVGFDAVVGNPIATCDAWVRIAAEGSYTLSIDAFRDEMDRRGASYDVMSRYVGSLIGTLMQSILCAALHPAKQRCARWLLMTQDRAQTNELVLGQDTIAMALGVRRATVTLVLNELLREGTLLLQRNRILIINRAALEAVACECYRLTRT